MQDAATKALDLAEKLQGLLYYEEGFGISPKTKTVMDRCYRSLKRVCDLHFGAENHGLFYAGLPGTPFKRSIEAKK